MKHGAATAAALIAMAGSGARLSAGGTEASTNGNSGASEIVVTAPRTDLYGTEGVGPEVLHREGIAPTVDGALEGMPGIDLTRRSFSGNDSQRLSIRGFDESRSLVMLNGRSLHGAGVYGGYYIDWASLSVEDVNAVEVIRGLAPAKYGNTLGGVVNISTDAGSEERLTEIAAGGGSLGTWHSQFKHSGPFGPLTYSICAGRYETDGYLRNAFVERSMLSARLGFALPADMELNAGLRFTDTRAGMIVYNMLDAWDYDSGKPESLDYPLGGPYVSFREPHTGPLDWGDGSYWIDRRMNLDLGLRRDAERFGFALRTYLADENREEYFYAADDPGRLVLRRDTEPEKNNWGWRTDLRNRIGSEGRHVLEYGLEGQYLGYGEMTVRSADADYFRWLPEDSPSKDEPITMLHGVYAQDLWTINDRVQLQAGIRVDDYRADGPEAAAVTVEETEAGPRLACVVRPWDGGSAALRVGRAYRFPTNPEYYWWYAGYQPDDRQDLTSEKAAQYEVELRQDLAAGLSLVARGYYYRVRDYIRTIFGYKPSRVVYNIDRVDFGGLELEARYDITSTLRL